MSWFRRPDRGTAPAGQSAAEAASDRLGRLEGITQAALSHLELDELLDAVLMRIRDALEVETASVLLRFGDVLTPTASRGFEEEVGVGIWIPIGKGFAGTIAAEQRPLLVEDVSQIEVINPLMGVKGLRSLLGVPLLHGGEVIGVMHVGTTTRRRFTTDDVITLQLAADRVAMAVAQARLYEAERDARAEAEAGQSRLRFLAEASEVLGSSLDYADALERVAELCVPAVADGCLVDVVGGRGSLERIAAKGKVEAPDGVEAVVESGEPRVTRSWMTVPLVARDRVLGVISFVNVGGDRAFGAEELEFAREIARRAATAIENANLYAEAEQRSRAVLALDHIGEGVFLLDRFGVIRLWNPAAESITGLPADAVVGRRAAEAVSGWSRIAESVPVSEFTQSPAHGETLPLDLTDRELWVLISGASFPDGTVYAFRDVTQERALRDLQSEFVATVSHELRTPLAAVYGAAMTLKEHAERLAQEDRERLFEIVYDEADRLNRIVDDILWASRLDGGRLDFAPGSFAPAALVETVLTAARIHAPKHVSFEVAKPPSLPRVEADADKVRQILSNLVDNAVKYSPDGGTVTVGIEAGAQTIRFAVSDEGIGIPAAELGLVFEKFYRLDPNQTRGVGGTGLGLYICRELARRMNGRIWVTSTEGEGSTFFVELPLTEEHAATEVLAHLTSG